MNLLCKNGFVDVCPCCEEIHTDDSACDYEECGECGYDHSLEPEEATRAHRLLIPHMKEE